MITVGLMFGSETVQFDKVGVTYGFIYY